VRNTPVVRIRRDASEFLTVSFMLRDPEDKTVAAMDDNMFTLVPDLVHDLSVSASGHKITIWTEERKIGFQCRYSRKSIYEVEKALVTDMLKNLPPGLDPPEPVQDPDSFYDTLAQISDLKDLIPIGMQRRDPVGTLIRWHVLQHLESDGKVPFIDFVSARLYGAGQCLHMRGGRLRYDGTSDGCGSLILKMAFCCQNRIAV
jgi:hypothetical protein